MINHYCDLKIKERILLHEVIRRNKKCEQDIGFDILSSVRNEAAVYHLKIAIKDQLKEGVILNMAKKILTLIES